MYKVLSLSLFATLVEILSNFGLKVFLARFFSKELYADYGTTLDICSLILVASFCFKDTYIYHFNKVRCLFFKYIKINIVLLILSLLFLTFALFYNRGKIETSILIYSSTFIISNILINIASQTKLAVREYNLVSVMMTMKAILVPVFILIIYSYKNIITPSFLFYSYSIANLIVSILIFIKFDNILKYTQNVEGTVSIKSFYKKGSISLVEHFSYTSTLYLSTFMLDALFTRNSVANYLAVSRPLYMAAVSLTSYPLYRFFFPELNDLYKKNDFTSIKQLNSKFSRVAIFYSVAVFIVSPLTLDTIIIHLFGDKYSGAFFNTLILLLTTPFVFITTYLNSHLKAKGDFKQVLYIRVTASLMFFISLFILSRFSKNSSIVVFSISIQLLCAFLLTIISLKFKGFNQETKKNKNNIK